MMGLPLTKWGEILEKANLREEEQKFSLYMLVALDSHCLFCHHDIIINSFLSLQRHPCLVIHGHVAVGHLRGNLKEAGECGV